MSFLEGEEKTRKLLKEEQQLTKAIQDAGFKVFSVREFRLIDVTTADYGYRTIYPQIDIQVHRKGQEAGIKQTLEPKPRLGFWKRLFVGGGK